MNTKTNAFKDYRRRVNIPLYDVAHLLQIDISNLSKIEQGIRSPNIQVILLYHVLFKAPITLLFTQQFEQLKSLWVSRSYSLIDGLKADQPPKSGNRIAYIESFVNRLITKENERA